MSGIHCLCLAAFGAMLAVPGASAALPSIGAVVNAANFQPGIASAAWIAIIGTNLSASTQAWGSADFNSSNLPQKLAGVSVSINGLAAYVYYVSPTQINVLAPDDPTLGNVQLVVTNTQGSSLPVTVKKAAAAPALFAYSQLSERYAVIQEPLDSGLVGVPNMLGPAVKLNTASPGETLVLYATGLGPVASGQPTGQLVAAPSPLANPITVTIGGQVADVQFAGLIQSGLYQINLTVPTLRDGDAQIQLSVNNIQSAGAVFLPVQAYGSLGGQTSPPIFNCVSGPVNSVTWTRSAWFYGQAAAASIGGTQICATCGVKPPLYGEFAKRLERSLETGGTVKACYDTNGQIYRLEMLHN